MVNVEGKDPAVAYSEFIAGLQYSSLPEDVVHTIKWFALDMLGVSLAGSTAPGCEELVTLVREWGGRGKSTLLNFGDRVPAPHAALVNATLAEARDFDDTYDRGIVHVMAPTVAAALAISEQRGGVSGHDLIASIAAGVEIMCRIGAGCRSPLTWTRTSTAGGFAAAATSARLMNYTASMTQNALGIAYVQAAGNSQTIEDGALVKRMQVGFAAKAGVVAAQLAGKGITGPLRIFEGKHGYFKLYERDNYDREILTSGLGSDFEARKLSVKPYPCARDSHAAIDAARELRDKGIEAESIASVTVRVSQAIFNVGGKPWANATGNPVVEAILSIPYAVAIMLCRGDLFIGDFSPECIHDPAVDALARKVTVVLDSALDPSALVPVSVEVELTNGGVHSATCNAMRGSPDTMLSEAEFLAKFRRCAEHARYAIDPRRLEEAIEMIVHLEDLQDVSALTERLCGRP